MANLLWLLPALLLPAALLLVRRQLRQHGPVAAWLWGLITSPFWLPVAGLVGFGVARLALGAVVVASNLPR